jgi:phosphate transport system substrate-binding protein
MTRCIPILLASALLHPACANQPLAESVTVDGSSTVYELSEAVASEFRSEHPSMPVNVAFSGTVTGFNRFCGGLIDIVDASRRITDEEQQMCASNGIAYVELPVAHDGITLIVHPKNDWASAIIVPELRALWEPAADKKVVKWNQLRAAWPDREIHLYGPGPESGTFDFFTEVIVGRPGDSRKDYDASGDDREIVNSVASDELGIGYVGFGHYDRNRDRLKAVAIDDLNNRIGSGPIEPTAMNLARGLYRPLARPLFIYVNARNLEKPAVSAFAQYYLEHAGRLGEDVGTIPLAGNGYQLAQQRLAKKVTGTMYAQPDAANMSVELLLTQ